MLQVGVIGATGYAGAELVKLLSSHPEVSLAYIGSRSYAGKKMSEVYPNLRGICDQECQSDSLQAAAAVCDVVFLALPAGLSTSLITRDILEKTKIIDLGPDFRINDADIYSTWYKVQAPVQDLLDEAVYGLCEWNGKTIKATKLVANPGCYTTCSILTLAPLFADNLIDFDTVIIDAKSGVSGAGRGEKLNSLFCECNESVKAYNVATHRHTPEIEAQLSAIGKAPVTISFTPHLIPMDRGILATCYAKLKPGVDAAKVAEAYATYYDEAPFVRILGLGSLPETRWVKGSNYCDIGWQIDSRTGRIIAIGAIDNLVKGAAGQAVQNMNILYGFQETVGLETAPMFP